jgi:hypothetical protein
MLTFARRLLLGLLVEHFFGPVRPYYTEWGEWRRVNGVWMRKAKVFMAPVGTPAPLPALNIEGDLPPPWKISDAVTFNYS